MVNERAARYSDPVGRGWGRLVWPASCGTEGIGQEGPNDECRRNGEHGAAARVSAVSTPVRWKPPPHIHGVRFRLRSDRCATNSL